MFGYTLFKVGQARRAGVDIRVKTEAARIRFSEALMQRAGSLIDSDSAEAISSS
jgi:hypothetical protein